jgi:hypothetical protein
MIERVNRETNTLITIARPQELGIDYGKPAWITYCNEHFLFVGHDTKQLAQDWAASPSGWCAGCRRMV